MTDKKSLQYHPFIRTLVPLTIGIVCGDFLFLDCPVPLSYACIAASAIAVFRSSRSKRSDRHFGPVLTAFMFVLGFMLMQVVWKEQQADIPPGNHTYRVVLTDHANEKPNSIGFQARLLPGNKDILLYFAQDSLAYTLLRGDSLLIDAKLNTLARRAVFRHKDLSGPHITSNSATGYHTYLQRKGIVATGFVPRNHWKITGHDSSPTLRQRADDARRKIIGMYRSLGFQGDELAVMSALTLGYKEELGDDIKQTYSTTGASHVLALSGLHIGLIYGIVLSLLHPLRYLGRKGRVAGTWATVITLACFAFFTGGAPSVVRSVIMVSALCFSKLQEAQTVPLNTVGATAFFMLIFCPHWLFDVGFRLSFAAVISIVYFIQKWDDHWAGYTPKDLSKKVKRRLQPFLSFLVITLSAQVGVLPLLLYYFHRFPIHFLITNVWVIPLITAILYTAVVLLFLTPLPGLQALCAYPVNWLLQIEHMGLRWLERLRFGMIDNVHLYQPEVLLGYVCIILFVRETLQKRRHKYHMPLLFLMAVIVFHYAAYAYDRSQTGMKFYNLRRCEAVHCIGEDGQSWLVLADSANHIGQIERSHHNEWTHRRLERPVIVSRQYHSASLCYSNQILSFKGKRLAFVCDDRYRHLQTADPLPVDILYVGKGYKGSVAQLNRTFKAHSIVIDAAVSSYRTGKLIQECSRLSIPYTALAQTGDMEITLD